MGRRIQTTKTQDEHFFYTYVRTSSEESKDLLASLVRQSIPSLDPTADHRQQQQTAAVEIAISPKDTSNTSLLLSTMMRVNALRSLPLAAARSTAVRVPSTGAVRILSGDAQSRTSAVSVAGAVVVSSPPASSCL